MKNLVFQAVIKNKKRFPKKLHKKYLNNPDKYIGDNIFEIRSSYEELFYKMLDNNKYVIKWGCECVKIKYFNMFDDKVHIYYPDFLVKSINKKTNKINTYLVEIKPEHETHYINLKKNDFNNKKELLEKHLKKELNSKRRKSSKRESIKRFLTNQSKWYYARKFCDLNNIEFKIIGESNLGI